MRLHLTAARALRSPLCPNSCVLFALSLASRRRQVSRTVSRAKQVVKSRFKNLVGLVALTLILYFFAYFCSVGVNHIPVKAVDVAMPQYWPWNSGIVHVIFSPVQLLDSQVLRPSFWQDKGGLKPD